MKPFNLNNLPSQQAFFYSGGWTTEMDSRFLSVLVLQKNNGCWNPPNVPATSAILCALYAVNSEFGRHFSFDDVTERVTHLETRYGTFRKMLKQKGAYWDQADNKVSMSDRSWTKITKKIPIARVYYHAGELEFCNLAQIFGPTVMKDEDGPPVINVSDNTLRINEPDYVNIPDTDSEEVTYPVMRDDSNIRRRFSADEAESTMMPRSRNAYPQRNAFPPAPRNLYEPPPGFSETGGETETGSSCASSSTWKWWSGVDN